MQTLTIEAWNARYRPEYNYLSYETPTFNGVMFETYGDEHAYVEKVSPYRVWTYVDTEDGGLAIINGYHLVNRIGYFVTDEPWTEDIAVTLEAGSDE